MHLTRRHFLQMSGTLAVYLGVNPTRLLAEEMVERDERGLYRLGATALPLRSRVAAWRDLGTRRARAVARCGLRPGRGGSARRPGLDPRRRHLADSVRRLRLPTRPRSSAARGGARATA